MQTVNKILGLFFFMVYWAMPLSIGQEINDSSPQRVELSNPSFEQLDVSNVPKDWVYCIVKDQSPPNVQPGMYYCTLVAQQGKHYMGMVGRDNGTFETIRQVMTKPLKAGVCYRMSVYLAKSSKYISMNLSNNKEENFNRPLKLTIWGVSGNLSIDCKIQAEDWLAESLPIHNDAWRKYTFYIQPPNDVQTLVFSANHVVSKPYCGNLLIDNISAIEPVSCTDLRQLNIGQKSVVLSLQQVSEVLTENAPRLLFGKKRLKLLNLNDEGRNEYFDKILSYFEKTSSYKLIIRVKQGKELSKQRIAFLYSYIFKYTNLKAQQVEIKPFTPKDEAFFWTFENEEMAFSFDSM